MNRDEFSESSSRLAMGGGILGLLAGLAVSIGVAFLDPGLF